MIRLYRIEVSIQGQIVAEHTVEAADALSAINLIEARYGTPPQVEFKTVHHDSGFKEHSLVVLDWHGYSFLARSIEPLPK